MLYKRCFGEQLCSLDDLSLLFIPFCAQSDNTQNQEIETDKLS
jgi:hypothetical protein